MLQQSLLILWWFGVTIWLINTLSKLKNKNKKQRMEIKKLTALYEKERIKGIKQE